MKYRFKEWRDETGAVIGTTPSISLFIDKDKTLTAYYEEVPIPEYVLTIDTTTGGTTDPLPGSYKYPENTTVKVTAIPDTGYNFDHWILDGITYTSNPVNVLMDADHTLTAYFSEVSPPPPETYNLTIVAATGGTTEPIPGIYEVIAGEIITVTAIPDEGYGFKHFELDGEVKMQNPINVGMDADHTLLAIFEVTAPPIKMSTIGIVAAIGIGTAGYAVMRRKK